MYDKLITSDHSNPIIHGPQVQSICMSETLCASDDFPPHDMGKTFGHMLANSFQEHKNV